MESFNFNLWYDTYDPDFIKISHESRIPEKWINYQSISRDRYDNSIIKPINRYVEFLYPRPELVSIEEKVVTLRQKTHADIFLLNKNGSFRNVDRPHMRQYYQTKLQYEKRSDCFGPIYLFYSPWFIDEKVKINFRQSADSPFEIYDSSVNYDKILNTVSYIHPSFIPFRFKKTGSHMITRDYGKIKRGSTMFDIVFTANDMAIERVKDFYEKN
jgi:hypothetical protein